MLTLKTEYIQLNAGAGDSDKIKRAAAVLERGGLVAFPTETGYGIGCAARAESIERLNEVKGRAAGKFYTLHISSPADLEKYVPNVPFRTAKFAGKCWPGPVTIVFELDEEALGTAVLRDGVISCIDTEGGVTLAEYTDYIVHEESGVDFIVYITDQSAADVMCLLAY